MPFATASDGVRLHYEETGSGTPIVFVHEFAGDHRSWEPQVRHFGRRYRVVAYAARGYPPSDVPAEESSYSQERAVDDVRDVLDALGVERAHIVGLSMGGYASLIFGLTYPERCLSITVAGAGYGSTADRSEFERDVERVAQRLLDEGIEAFGEVYTRGPTRVQFEDKDPRGFEEFRQQFRESSTLGHANTMLGVQRNRPSILALEERLRGLTVPTLIVTGDEDEPCLEPGLFMKRTIRSAALVLIPRSGHTVNLEEPAAFNRSVEEFMAQVDAGRWSERNPASLSESALLPAGERERG
jgi:pimeloyl-ACP methyl ester carboxylesterase